ncbi:MAG: glycosyltransferase [Sphingobacteriales bacterium]|uniref:glycosyltransferase family 4 protein n=1 Tax=Hydrotalea flava TaxID=714549 RepID=UPI00082DEDB0|nr:glycosyltransferase family 1 protein [Hydrotalea flava]RTL50026.1 MAG: glycosyltransferase [Sphingobacteriales bacterium]
MKCVALNARFLRADVMEGYGNYVHEIFKRLVLQHPETSFIFIFDRPYDEAFITGSNIVPLVVPPSAKHALSFKYWYDVKVPLVLRKFAPDVLVQPYGFASLTTKIPQLLVVHDLAFKHHPSFIPKHHLYYYRYFTPRFLKKVQSIVTVSDFSKEDIAQHYPFAAAKTTVVYNAAKSGFQPLPFEARQAIKTQYANGCEYFLFVGGIHPRKNLLNLLKAFTIFKKWQKSNMKLLVAGRLAWQYNDIMEKLDSYKHRDDVVLLDYVSDAVLQPIMAAAYALIYPSFFEGFGVPVIEAMQSGTPVICSNTGSLPEIAGHAALLAAPDDVEELAQQMQLIYKDEIKRNQLIEAGKQHSKKFNWDDSANRFWQAIQQLAKK